MESPPANLQSCYLLDCDEYLSAFTVGREEVQELLPSGFRVGNTASTALRADRDELAEVLVSVTRADERRGQRGSTYGSVEVIGMLVVEPPHELSLLGADLHAIGLFTFIDGATSLESKDSDSGDRQISLRVVRPPIELRLSCSVSGVGPLHVPPRRSRLFFATSGEVAGVTDIACSAAVAGPSGAARVEMEGISTLPDGMEGTAVQSSGFDKMVEPLLVPPFTESDRHAAAV